MENEQKFYDTLKEIFVGAEVEGQSGFINLMRIKSRYFQQLLDRHLKKDIDDALKPFPDFREELFDKLYTFFNRYFSESGSIYFRYTPLHQNVYEKVYTDDKDVILFWKTHMLYYVKTDRLFRSLDVELDGHKFFFDVSTLQHKRANEKRELIYDFKELREDGTIVFEVSYSVRGRKTKVYDILKKVGHAASLPEVEHAASLLSEKLLKKAFRVFGKQSEVDYFINKNAKAFLREQFDIWLYQYVFSGESEFTETRIKQLQTLKTIAFKIIDFISQFEDELVKIWNKPKFVLNSNYVITLERLADQSSELVQRIFDHENFDAQIDEWKKLEIVDDDFDAADVFENTLIGDGLKRKYQHLPLDTKYFKNLEIELLGLFEHLEEALDGWLIKSENYQALNSILPKFRGRVQTIYIDPPFNLGKDADFFYSVNYKDASWMTLLENRLRLAKDILKDTGSIFARCDYNGNMLVKLLMNEVFGEENYKNEILINRKRQSIGTPNKFEVENEFLFLYSKTDDHFRKNIYRGRSLTDFRWTGFLKQGERHPRERKFLGKTLYPRKGQHFSLIQDKVNKLLKEHFLRLKCRECGAIYYLDKEQSGENFVDKILKAGKEKFKYLDITVGKIVYGVKSIDKCLYCNADNFRVEYLPSDEVKITDNWKDIPSYSDNFEFKTENSELLLKRVIEPTSDENDLAMDFFLGSGTTTAVAHKLGRKWLGVEMGEHFYSVILPRMKKVLEGDRSGISKDVDWQGGGFFKYYELEQYEDTLRRVKYDDSELFYNPYADAYTQYVFMPDSKLLEALDIDYEKNNVDVDFSKLYDCIDLPETLSNLLGSPISKITADEVELENGEKIRLDELDYKIIKPLIWW